MRVAKTALGKCVCALIGLSAGCGAQLALGVSTAAATGADLYVVSGTVAAPGIGISNSEVPYTLQSGGCVDVPVPVVGQAPTFIDVSGSDTGVCSSLSGGGHVTGACNNGTLTAESWTVTEPTSDQAVFDGEGVIVGGVAILAGTPSVPGLGFWDPSGPGTTPGSAVAVAVFTPKVGGTPGCNADLMAGINAVVAAVY